MLVKIFRFLISERGDAQQKDLANLWATCKRFNYIVNHKLLTINESQFPVLFVHSPSSQPHNPLVLKNNRCQICRVIETKARFKFIKYKRLSLHDPERCCVETIAREYARLQTITDLKLAFYRFDHIAHYSMYILLSKLENIKRLSYDVKWCPRWRVPIPAGLIYRVMEYIRIDSMTDEYLFKYFLNNLPTRRLVIRISPHRAFWRLSWIKSYVTQHLSILESCHITYDNEYSWPSTIAESDQNLLNEGNKFLASLGYNTTK